MFAHAATSACASSSQIPRVVSHRKSSNAVAATSSSSSSSQWSSHSDSMMLGSAFETRRFATTVANRALRKEVSDTNANRASGRGMLLLAKATAEVRVFASFGRVARGERRRRDDFGAATFCAFSFGSAKNLLFVSAVGLLSNGKGGGDCYPNFFYGVLRVVFSASPMRRGEKRRRRMRRPDRVSRASLPLSLFLSLSKRLPNVLTIFPLSEIKLLCHPSPSYYYYERTG